MRRLTPEPSMSWINQPPWKDTLVLLQARVEQQLTKAASTQYISIGTRWSEGTSSTLQHVADEMSLTSLRLREGIAGLFVCCVGLGQGTRDLAHYPLWRPTDPKSPIVFRGLRLGFRVDEVNGFLGHFSEFWPFGSPIARCTIDVCFWNFYGRSTSEPNK